MDTLVLNKTLQQATEAWREATGELAEQYATAIERKWGTRPKRMQSARRGDLVAVVITRRDWIGQGSSESLEIDLRVVCSVTRDGHVKATRTVHGYVIPRERETYASPQYMLVGRDEIDVAGAMDAYAQHTYEGHPTQVRPFDSLDEARDLLRPFLVASQ